MAWRVRLVVLWTFGVTAFPTIVDAQSRSEENLCDIVSAQFDNDEMGGSDRHYTSGFRLACTTSPPAFLDNIIASHRDPNAITNSWSTYSLGLNMFTPDDLSRSDPIDDDQPYAGWLHLGFGLERETIPRNDHPRFLDTFELQLGVIGPLSGAEHVQRFGHDLTNATDPKGWGNQLDNEPGINLFYSRQWTGAQEFSIPTGNDLPALYLDVTPQLGAALGNVYTFGAAGLTLRLGQFLRDDHGLSVIRPSLLGSDFYPEQKGLSAYIFGSLQGRVVGRNIFLDGNTFDNKGPSVDKETLVGEAKLGLAITYGDIRVGYTHVFRSREFDGQDPQDFGSISLSLRL
ncbi:MAG: lipid A deacylase LpxR family protein [Geminicoccaceae bacterium]